MRLWRPSARLSRQAAWALRRPTGGWRGSRKPALPDNLVLPKLPPYSPALDPMETVFRYPRNNRLANRVFADVSAVAEAFRKARERSAAAPDRLASLVRRKWAIAPAHPRQNE